MYTTIHSEAALLSTSTAAADNNIKVFHPTGDDHQDDKPSTPSTESPTTNNSCKISSRYTQLRKQLRACNNFQDNYFVLEVNKPHDHQDDSNGDKKKKRKKRSDTNDDTTQIKKETKKRKTTKKKSETVSETVITAPQPITQIHHPADVSIEQHTSPISSSTTSLYENTSATDQTNFIVQMKLLQRLQETLEQLKMNNVMVNTNTQQSTNSSTFPFDSLLSSLVAMAANNNNNFANFDSLLNYTNNANQNRLMNDTNLTSSNTNGMDEMFSNAFVADCDLANNENNNQLNLFDIQDSFDYL
jgi:hypothetical protein